MLLGANLGACGVALFSLLILVLRVKTTQRMIALSLPPFVQQIIAVIVGGYDIETGLRLLVQLYESRGIRNRLVDALIEIAAITQNTGSLLRALRSRAGLLGEENLRRVPASLARGHEHGTSIVKELQDIVRSLAPPGRALGGIAYLSRHCSQPWRAVSNDG